MLNLLVDSQPQPLGGIIGGEGLGPFGGLPFLGNNPGLAGAKLGSAISAIIGLFTVVAGIWFLFQFVLAGLQWLGAGGDKQGLEQAHQKITNSLIGLVIIVAGVTIIKLIGGFLGFDILNPASFLNAIQFK